MSVYNKIVLGDETLIDLTDATLMGSGTTATADAAKILKGTTANPNTAYGADGVKITGTCTYDADTSDANATAAMILKGTDAVPNTAYVNGVKITGNMNNHDGDSVELDGATSHNLTTAEAGFYPQGATFTLSDAEKAKLIATNIKQGVTILGVDGSFAGDEVVCTPAAQEAYTTQVVYSPADFPAVGGKTPTAFSNFTVKAIAREDVANAKGTGIVIGKVKS